MASTRRRRPTRHDPRSSLSQTPSSSLRLPCRFVSPHRQPRLSSLPTRRPGKSQRLKPPSQHHVEAAAAEVAANPTVRPKPSGNPRRALQAESRSRARRRTPGVVDAHSEERSQVDHDSKGTRTARSTTRLSHPEISNFRM
jgi:hypothetical protein